MIDQEIASIIHFILGTAKGISPYYFNMPQDFAIPSFFFPPPEFEAFGDTLQSFRFDYSWTIPVFAYDNSRAHAIAANVAHVLETYRRVVPLIGEDGKPIGKGLRLKDPEVKDLDKEGVPGVAGLVLHWSSRRPYYEEDAPKMLQYILNINDPETRPKETADG